VYGSKPVGDAEPAPVSDRIYQSRPALDFQQAAIGHAPGGSERWDSSSGYGVVAGPRLPTAACLWFRRIEARKSWTTHSASQKNLLSGKVADLSSSTRSEPIRVPRGLSHPRCTAKGQVCERESRQDPLGALRHLRRADHLDAGALLWLPGSPAVAPGCLETRDAFHLVQFPFQASYSQVAGFGSRIGDE
jgi:hypothetical protein